ncbi:hypothetical protein QS257_11135 [Terrilactibacillus sp. S3-3]|nr:hypothetical protein QS257_11135 [Terrilactibacillus sp. S3-3]
MMNLFTGFFQLVSLASIVLLVFVVVYFFKLVQNVQKISNQNEKLLRIVEELNEKVKEKEMD